MSKALTPEDLANMLVELEPTMHPEQPITQIPFSIDMLREAYLKSKQRLESQAVHAAFTTALENWTDVEVKEFLCRWLLDPPHATYLEKESAERLRSVLQEIYVYIFEE